MPGFVQLKKNRSHAVGGGILILIRKSIAFVDIPVISPHPAVELCEIKLTKTIPSLDIIVCYRGTVPPPDKLSQNTFDDIASLIDDDSHTILAGDFNAHNIVWNSDHTDSYGEYLLNSIGKKDLSLHNPNTLTHQNPGNGSLSKIDLILSTMNIASNIIISVLDDTWGSDHFPISCSVNLDKNLYHKKIVQAI